MKTILINQLFDQINDAFDVSDWKKVIRLAKEIISESEYLMLEDDDLV